MSAREIHYLFEFPSGEQAEMALRFDPETFEQLPAANGADAPAPPAWTALDFHQCDNCPLAVAEVPTCPLAHSLVDIATFSDELVSHASVKVTVTTPERRIQQDTTVQRAVSAVMGLVAPTSGCPHLAVFRPMARFHLPLASPEETTYRVSGMWLLGQLLRQRNGDAAALDVSGLEAVYREVQQVNRALASRLRAATTLDGAVNAVIILDVLAQAVPSSLDDSLDRLQGLFAAHTD